MSRMTTLLSVWWKSVFTFHLRNWPVTIQLMVSTPRWCRKPASFRFRETLLPSSGKSTASLPGELDNTWLSRENLDESVEASECRLNLGFQKYFMLIYDLGYLVWIESWHCYNLNNLNFFYSAEVVTISRYSRLSFNSTVKLSTTRYRWPLFFGFSSSLIRMVDKISSW